MKTIALSLWLALVLVVATPAAADERFPILRWLVRENVLEQASLDPILEAQQQIASCQAAVRDGRSSARDCIAPRRSRMKAQIQLFAKARAKLGTKSAKQRLRPALRKELLRKVKLSVGEVKRRLWRLDLDERSTPR